MGLNEFLTLEQVKMEQASIEAWVKEQPAVAAVAYFLIYVAVTAVSLPGAAVMTLAGGAVFGFWWGFVVVSFASTIGATLAMLVARFVFQEQVQRRFARHLVALNEGIEKEGGFYLFTLRLVPVIPFFVINLAMGLTRIKILTFFLVSQLGMLAGTAVYVNAGTQLAEIETASDILSVELLIAFGLLGIFPLIAKKMVDLLRARKVYQGFIKPSSYDRDVVVLGAGSGGVGCGTNRCNRSRKSNTY